MGVGIDKARHDDAATSVHKFRLGVLGLQIRGGADLHDLAAIGDHAAVRQVADALRIRVMTLPFASKIIKMTSFCPSFAYLIKRKGASNRCRFETPTKRPE